MNEKNFLYYFFTPLRFLLYPFSLLYGAIIWLRNKLYDSGFSSSIEFSLPVINVGNLSVGGTGKTPHVEYLVQLLQYRYKVATMSRGYKRHTQGFLLAEPGTNALRIGDEPMQYFMKFPELTVCVAEERLTGIPALLQRKPETEVIILDDAYQHRSVKPGLNLLITDYSKPFYNDHILPLGRLRENRSAYKRANMILVSKCPQDISETRAQSIKEQIAPLAHQQVYFTGIQYGQAYNLLSREPIAIDNQNVVLVCCIANPATLISFIEAKAAAVHVLSYPDHHYFVTKDLEEIKAAYENWNLKNKIIVTTEKDATRLYLHQQWLQDCGITIVVLPIQVNILLNQQAAFDEQVNLFVEKTIAENQWTDNEQG